MYLDRKQRDSTSARIRGQTCTPSPTASASAYGAHSSGQDRTCSPPSTTLLPRLRYHSASSNARVANVRWTVIPTTSGIGAKGGRPSRRFSSQYRTSQCSGVVAAKLVKASVGVSTCLPKLELGSFG